MTKTFTQRKRTFRRVDVPSRSNSPMRIGRSKPERSDARKLLWTGSDPGPSQNGGGSISEDTDGPSEALLDARRGKSKSGGILRAFSKVLQKGQVGDGASRSIFGSSKASPTNSSSSSLERPTPLQQQSPNKPSFFVKRATPVQSPRRNGESSSQPQPPTSPTKGGFPSRLRRAASVQSMRSVVTTCKHTAATPAEEPEPKASNYPHQHLVSNIQHFMRYSSAAYGQAFLRILGIGKHDVSPFISSPRS